MTCSECGQWQCVCVKKEAKPVRNWLISTCTEPGCTVVICSLPGEPVGSCKWHRAGTAYLSHQIKHTMGSGPLISTEEFGSDLFEAIKTQGALRQAENNAELYKRKGITDLEQDSIQRIKAFQDRLATILDRKTIAPPDIKRILAIR